MRWLLLVLVGVMATGCVGVVPMSKFGTGGRAQLAIAIDDGNIHRRGGDLRFTTTSGASTATVTVVNLKTNASRTTEVAVPASGAAALTLDAAALPDVVEGAKVQRFEVRIDVPQVGGMAKQIYVVADADVQPFPAVPIQVGGVRAAGDGPQPILAPGKGPMTPDATQAGIATYLAHATAAWGLVQPTITKAPIARGAVTFPPFLREMPADVQLVEARIEASFGKLLVPEEHSPTGEADVFAPVAMRAVLTQTDPAVLVRMTAERREAKP